MFKIALFDDVRAIESQLNRLASEAENLRRIKDEYERRLSVQKKQIEDAYRNEHSKLNAVDINMRQMSDKVKTESRSEEKKAIDKIRKLVLRNKEAVRQKYKAQETEYRNAITILGQNINDVCNGNSKIITKYATSKPNHGAKRLNLYEIDSLLVRIKDDTFLAFIKRLTKAEGYYKQKLMVKDYVREASAAIQSLNQLIDDVLPVQCQKEIDQIEMQGNIDLQRALARLAEEFDISTDSFKKSEEQTNAKRVEIEKRRDEGISRCNILAKQYAEDTERRVVEFQKKVSSVYSLELITMFMKRLEKQAHDTGYSGKDWEIDLKRESADFFCVGRAIVPFLVDDSSLKNELRKTTHPVFICNSFELPLLMSNKDNFCLFMQYASRKDLVHKVAQNFVLQKLRSNPYCSVDVICTDPIERGKNLNSLLGPIDENAEIGVAIINDNEVFEKKLKEILEKTDVINSRIGSVDSVYSFNRINGNRINETLLVICDIEKALTENSVKFLSTIFTNAHRCGISIIATSSCSIECIKNSFSDKIRPLLGYLDLFDKSLSVNDEKATITLKSSIPVRMDSVDSCGVKCSFMDNYRKKREENAQIDNNFSSYFKGGDTPLKDSSEGIFLPIFVDNSFGGGKLHNFVLGTTANTHTLLTGGTGSGKSSLLHLIVATIIMNYHPDDVELWLVDYGRVEFSQYVNNLAPHIRFLSTEKTQDFTFSFLRYLKQYFSEREMLFKKEGVSSLAEYRRIHGALSLPRVVLLVDEFHVMTQHCRLDSTYKLILENALTEYRKFGLSCVFSNQTISGLIGFTDTALTQIRNRVAMFNKIQEMKETLSATSSNFPDEMISRMERTGIGEVWYKEWAGNDFSIEHYKSLLIEKEERNRIIENANRKMAASIDSEVFIRDGEKNESFPFVEIKSLLKKSVEEKRMYLGVPTSIERFFSITPERKYNNNIAILGGNDDLAIDIIASIVTNLSMLDDTRIVVLADSTDKRFKEFKKLDFSFVSNMKLYDDYSSICRVIDELHSEILEKEQFKQETFIFYFGFADMIDEFCVSPEKAKRRRSASSGNVSIDNIDKVVTDKDVMEMSDKIGIDINDFLAVFGREDNNVEETCNRVYNALEDISELFQLGSRYGLFNIVNIGVHSEIEKLRSFDIKNFIHKISLKMSREDAIEWKIRLESSDGIDDSSALYTNAARGETHSFKPFVFHKNMR